MQDGNLDNYALKQRPGALCYTTGAKVQIIIVLNKSVKRYKLGIVFGEIDNVFYENYNPGMYGC